MVLTWKHTIFVKFRVFLLHPHWYVLGWCHKIGHDYFYSQHSESSVLMIYSTCSRKRLYMKRKQRNLLRHWFSGRIQSVRFSGSSESACVEARCRRQGEIHCWLDQIGPSATSHVRIDMEASAKNFHFPLCSTDPWTAFHVLPTGCLPSPCYSSLPNPRTEPGNFCLHCAVITTRM
jgi:hypothetical protein